jgi:rSAM/selenodomain-associated transferase 1
MRRAMAEPVAVAVLAKAPLPGLAKTRLIPALGAEGAAALQVKLIERAVTMAHQAAIGPVTLWAVPDAAHPLFAALRQRFNVALTLQPDGDLGARMHAGVVGANGPALVIGTDCPALTADHLRKAADALRSHDAVVVPAEDGGYVLIGLRKPEAALFTGMAWGSAAVMAKTRRRLRSLGLSCCELDTLWDVDTPEDLARLRRARLFDLGQSQ